MPEARDDNLDIHIVDFDDESTPLSSHFVSIDNGVFKQSVLPNKAMLRWVLLLRKVIIAC